MADDKNLRGPQDSARVAMGEDYEVADWRKKCGEGRERLQEAVDAVGNSVDAISTYLSR